MATKLGRALYYFEYAPLIKLLDNFVTWSCLITITTVLITAKLGRIVTYHEKLLLLKLLDPIIMWFCEVTWLINYFISPLALDQWLPNMVIW